MDTEDLKKFLVVARENNLHSASEELNVTPGALSKTIKRIENKLNIQLFDRVGRNIVINQQGAKFREYALHLVHEADQVISEFSGVKENTTVKITGPSILLQHYLPKLLAKFDQAQYSFNLDANWEGLAMKNITTGQAHLALVTKVAIKESSLSKDFNSLSLGKAKFCIVASKNHPLFSQYPQGEITTKQLREFAFACPNVSPFCGIARGIGSDGWIEDKYPRKVAYRCSDFSVLLSFVRAGLALAYVPDFVARSLNLNTIQIVDMKDNNAEDIELVFKPSLASGWLNKLIEKLRK